MEESNLYTPERLQMFTYRYLQRISKKMGLPANLKKVQLIAMIHAKKSRTPEEVENMILAFKLQRFRLSQAEKNKKNCKSHLCVTGDDTPSTIQSPPITVTPNLHTSVRQLIQYKPKQAFNLNKIIIRKSVQTQKQSIMIDRILRKVKSNGIRNSIIGVIKAQNSTVNNETGINISAQDGVLRLNKTAILRKRAVTRNHLDLQFARPPQVSSNMDNMERMGMDVTIRCMLCSWAGSRTILESHVRQNHSNEIKSPNTNKCNVTCTVGRLVQHRLLCQIIEYRSVLYVLSAKYEDPGGILFNIAMISQETIIPKYAKITLFNKVTGGPFSWQGEVHQISPSMLHENQTNCLKVELNNLDLLPNIANLNRQLVIKSPGKVIVGTPEMHNIQIVVNVNFPNVINCVASHVNSGIID